MQPHLIFPQQQKLKIPKAKPFPKPVLHTPPIQKKARWITEKFNSLFDDGQLSAQPLFWPERTLVFETIGSVKDFYNALKKHPNYKFLMMELGEELDPDEDYYFAKADGQKDTKKLTTHLYFSMVNRTSLGEIRSCWEKYKKGKKLPAGSASLKAMFQQLKNIRFWDTEDRLNVSGLREDLLARINNEEEMIPIEIELWFYPAGRAREILEKQVTDSIRKINGRIANRCVVEEIGYHALLGEISSKYIQDLLDEKYENIDLVRCDSVMFFRPTGQCCVSPIGQEASIELPDDKKHTEEETRQPPVVALLDGYPVANHQALKGRLIIDDPLDFADMYQHGEHSHGTSMASIILHGDKSNNEPPLGRQIVLCPIMVPDSKDTFNQVRLEKIPDNQLPLDLIHTIVRRLLVGTKENPALAENVKIINISIGDHHRLFDNRISPWARLLDYLSYTFNVLFVVSAGNHADQIPLDIPASDFDVLTNEKKEHLILTALQKNSSEKRLRSPAEAINVLSVGALHHDNFEGAFSGDQINPFTSEGMPSPLNPLSWGAKRSVKPEIVMPGGRQTYRNANKFYDKKNVLLTPLYSSLPPGLQTAAPGNVPGKLNTYIYSAGTSNATAIATRRLAQLYETLQDLSFAERGGELDKKSEAVLLKALLCHGAQPNDSASKKLEKVIRENPLEKRFKANIARFVGYGGVDVNRLFGCETNQATLLRSGRIRSGERLRFQLPLPPSLSSKVVPRRLIVTLAWFSPVTAQRSYYREAKLWFDVVDKNYESLLGTDLRHYDGNIVQNGTLQHEIFYSGKKSGVFTSDDLIEIDVNCVIKHEDTKSTEVFFGIVVTLDTQDSEIPVYNEVKNGINKLVEQHSKVTRASI